MHCGISFRNIVFDKFFINLLNIVEIFIEDLKDSSLAIGSNMTFS